jgi:hypothetical protein
MRLYQIDAATYEESTPGYPVVVHQFIGRTLEEATGYLKAHFKSDRFFSDCTKKGRFANFRCGTRIEFSGWVDR